MQTGGPSSAGGFSHGLKRCHSHPAGTSMVSTFINDEKGQKYMFRYDRRTTSTVALDQPDGHPPTTIDQTKRSAKSA
jgi:hypothetical protein